jgi:hypothetical protein
MGMSRPRIASRFFLSSWRQRPFSPKRAAAFLFATIGLRPQRYFAIKRAIAVIRS